MQGQAEWCQRNKDQNRLHTGGSCGAASLLLITSSVSTYVYLCTYCIMYVNSSALHLHRLLSFIGIYFFFFSQEKWIESLAAECTSTEEHTSPGAFAMASRSRARIYMCLTESEQWQHSFVVFGNSNVGALNCKSWITLMLSLNSWHQFIACSLPLFGA